MDNTKKRHENTNKILIQLVIGVITIVMMTCCSFSEDKPSNDWLIENIPSELLTYYLKDQEYTSSVESLEIERRSTEDGMDDAFCVLNLTDDNLKRILHIEFISKDYDQGGWNLESWTEYQEEKFELVKGLNEEEAVTYLTEEEGYTGLSNFQDKSAPQSGILSYSFDVKENYKYINTSGNLTLEIKYHAGKKTPRHFNCSEYVDTSNVKSKWKLDGTYKLAEDPESYLLEAFEASIKEKDGKLQWEYVLDDGRGGRTASGTEEMPKYKTGTPLNPEAESGPASLAEGRLRMHAEVGYRMKFKKDTVYLSYADSEYRLKKA